MWERRGGAEEGTPEPDPSTNGCEVAELGSDARGAESDSDAGSAELGSDAEVESSGREGGESSVVTGSGIVGDMEVFVKESVSKESGE